MRSLVFCFLFFPCSHVESLVLRNAPCHTPSRMLEAKLERKRWPSSTHLAVPYLQKSLLKASSADAASLEDDQPQYKYNDAQKESMRQKYKVLSIVYAFLATTLVLMPDRTLTKRLASKLGAAGGFGVAAGISRILSDANDKERLHSATYKRLNVGLLGFSLFGLLSVPGEAAFLPTAGSAMVLTAVMNSARILGVIVSYTGWSMGVASRPVLGQPTVGSIALLTPRKAVEELATGTLATFKGLKVQKVNKKKSLTYRNCMLLVWVSMVSCFLEGLFCMRVSVTNIFAWELLVFGRFRVSWTVCFL